MTLVACSGIPDPSFSGHRGGASVSETHVAEYQSANRGQFFGSQGVAAVHGESLVEKCALTLRFFLFSSGSWSSESHHFLPSWFITAGKMRDFWGQMCFHSTIIMPLKILIALAVFLGDPWAGPAGKTAALSSSSDSQRRERRSPQCSLLVPDRSCLMALGTGHHWEK